MRCVSHRSQQVCYHHTHCTPLCMWSQVLASCQQPPMSALRKRLCTQPRLHIYDCTNKITWAKRPECVCLKTPCSSSDSGKELGGSYIENTEGQLAPEQASREESLGSWAGKSSASATFLHWQVAHCLLTMLGLLRSLVSCGFKGWTRHSGRWWCHLKAAALFYDFIWFCRGAHSTCLIV